MSPSTSENPRPVSPSSRESPSYSQDPSPLLDIEGKGWTEGILKKKLNSVDLGTLVDLYQHYTNQREQDSQQPVGQVIFSKSFGDCHIYQTNPSAPPPHLMG